MIRFRTDQHSAVLVVRPPALRDGAKGVEVIITSAHALPRGPVRYEGGYKRQKLAATVFPYNKKTDFFDAGLALHAGGGAGCALSDGKDVCRTVIPAGFIRFRRHRWKKLKITLFKPTRRPATVRILFRPVCARLVSRVQAASRAATTRSTSPDRAGPLGPRARPDGAGRTQ